MEEDLEVAGPGDVDDRGLVLRAGVLGPGGQCKVLVVIIIAMMTLRGDHGDEDPAGQEEVSPPGLLGDEAPQLVQVDAGLAEVRVVRVHVEVPHAHLDF